MDNDARPLFASIAMKFRLFLSLLLIAAASATAADGDGAAVAPERHVGGDERQLAPGENPERHQRMRRQMREHWGERGHADGGPRWRRMEPEERQRLRDEIRQHRNRFPHGERPGGGGG